MNGFWFVPCVCHSGTQDEGAVAASNKLFPWGVGAVGIRSTRGLMRVMLPKAHCYFQLHISGQRKSYDQVSDQWTREVHVFHGE